MNWWTKITLAMPLPDALNTPTDRSDGGLGRLDKRLTSDEAAQLTQPNMSFEGHGANGVAYSVPHGIVKITTDRYEAVTARWLLRNPCARTVVVYGVKDIKDGVWQLDLERVRGLGYLDIGSDFHTKYNDLLAGLRACGINSPDMNEDNIGIRSDGTWVLMDLGLSDVSGLV